MRAASTHARRSDQARTQYRAAAVHRRLRGGEKIMATTNVLLREDVDNLGVRGEIVRVKAGYARNYLLPRKLAVAATAGNVKQIEGERKALLKREAHDRASAEAQAGQLRTLSL